jgi:transcriptional regulator with XRE-family HTH domain
VLLPFRKQREIARRLDVSTSYVSMIVNGSRPPRSGKGRQVAVAVSRALGMKFSEAFGEIGQESPSQAA